MNLINLMLHRAPRRAKPAMPGSKGTAGAGEAAAAPPGKVVPRRVPPQPRHPAGPRAHALLHLRGHPDASISRRG